ncbi:recombinase family protein [Pectobacterium aquaticum]|uniref:recombinase family protein n=1 Tax=Pectobacterium aquaticum TaxID=2204145 RepID=UPI000E258ED2|nr:recombinase family protein [Pectobacterium aquaticum]RRO08143.1 recombinase family protein [Pectobacterium aquaticum]
MRKAISYIRFSSKAQATGDSTKRQSRLITNWLKQHPDYYLDDSLRFQDLGISGFSGANAKTGAFGEILAAIQSGFIEAGSVLLVESLDRVSRQDIDLAGEQLRKILRAGVDVVTLVDNEHYTKESLKDALSMIKALLVMERAHEESVMKSHRLRAVWASKRDKALSDGTIMSKRCVAWLKVSDDRKTFEFVPDNVMAVQRVFQLRLEGLSHIKIARQMNIEGFATLNQYSPKAKNGWSQTSVTELLSNRAVIGVKVPSKSMLAKGTPDIPNYYPAIITPEQFYAVQQLKILSKGRRPSSDNPFATNLFKGVMRCGECGLIMIVSGATADGKRQGLYKCSNKGLGRCNSAGISRLQTDKALVQGLLYNTNRLDLQATSDITPLQEELSELVTRKEKLLKLAELADDVQSVAIRLKELNANITSVNAAIADHHQRLASSHTETLLHLDLSEKKHRVEAQIIIKRIIKSVVMNTAKRTCDITFHNGVKLNNYPLSYIIDGSRFGDMVSLMDDKEFTFTENSRAFTPPHIRPDWVSEYDE